MPRGRGSRRGINLGGAQWARRVPPPPSPASPPEPPKPVSPPAAGAPLVRGHRRTDLTEPDDDGFVWMVPSPTAWPNVKPNGMGGNPPGPRTQMIGYNLEQRKIRTVFRDGTPWQYSNVSPDEWERIRRTASTGRFINRVLNSHPYGREDFKPPAPVVFYPR